MNIVKVTSQDYPLIYAEASNFGLTTKMNESLGWSFSRRIFKISEKVRESYFIEKEYKKFKRFILASKPGFLLEVLETCEREYAALRSFITTHFNFSQLDDVKLAQLLKNYFTLAAAVQPGGWIVVKLPDYLEGERTTLSEEKKWCFKTAMAVRKNTDGIIEQSFSFVRNILREVSSRSGIDFKLLEYATMGEIIDFLEKRTPFDLPELHARRKGMFYLGGDSGRIIAAEDLNSELSKLDYEVEQEKKLLEN